MSVHCPGCGGYDEGLRDPIRGQCPGVDVSYDVLEALVKSRSLDDKVRLRAKLRDWVILEAAELEAHRQHECEHLRAKEGEHFSGLVSWYCPDCHATKRISKYRERGAE